jgi:hypothetical protein
MQPRRWSGRSELKAKPPESSVIKAILSAIVAGHGILFYNVFVPTSY